MVSSWRNFIDGLDIAVELLHRDEFQEYLQKNEAYLPAAFKFENVKIRPFMTAEEMNGLVTLDELGDLVRSRL